MKKTLLAVSILVLSFAAHASCKNPAPRAQPLIVPSGQSCPSNYGQSGTTCVPNPGAGYAFVVPSGDAHLSEYTHPAYDRRAFISGFTGSAGTAVVTADAALLWTDGRYFLQAEQELSPHWTLMRQLQPGVPTIEAWLASRTVASTSEPCGTQRENGRPS